MPRQIRALSVLPLLLFLATGCEAPPVPAAPIAARSSQRAAVADLADLHRAIADRATDRWVQGGARVKKLLPDDNEGSRHQRFLLAVDGGTVLVAHNIDLAPRAPVQAGAVVGFRGEFVWNDKGGVLHWTHHDPKGKPGGWLEVGGRRFE
ncbi:MAG: DUF3465 domain-containing protein [Deltaproteobacteria bacterium]|nr:DUF3465 domain-containing protein [Deltaproteobacteria bacterium]